MSERFTKEASRLGYHGCDQCMAVDTDAIQTKGRLDQMWTDGESGETLCTECKERRENGRMEVVDGVGAARMANEEDGL